MKQVIALLTACCLFLGIMQMPAYESVAESIITFDEVSLHDPSIMKANGTYYIIGSHMASAKSTDLMNWTQMSTTPDDVTLFRDVRTELAEALEWGQSDTFWAGDWIQLADGRYYMYYCVCKGDSPQSCIGLAVADHPEGPYTNLGVFLKSSGSAPFTFTDENGNSVLYDANIHPNAVDPNVFFDEDGKLWMVYGSYSGGIFILQLDETTGLPLDGQGYYGKKLLGGYHARIEAPYILYSKESGYYYMFLSFGGLDATGGYNMRVCRASSPDGPYYDSMGNDMINCKGVPGQYLEAQDEIISQYGTKIVSNFTYTRYAGETEGELSSYVSAGHNTAYFDEETGEYYLIFHTRFASDNEGHQVRVHQMFLNEDDWLVAAPHRYAKEKLGNYTKAEVIGNYKMVNHGRETTPLVINSMSITLESNNTISGSVSGTWELVNGNRAILTIDGNTYEGVFLNQYDPTSNAYTMTFSVLASGTGTALWGSKIVPGENNVRTTISGTHLLNKVSYTIKNINSGLKLETQDASTSEGTNIQQWSHIDGAHQEWRVTDLNNGYVKITSMANENMAMTVDGSTTANGVNVMLSAYTGAENQQFKLIQERDGNFGILTRSSGDNYALDVFDFSTVNGGNLVQWEYFGNSCQIFEFEPSQPVLSDGIYQIRNLNSGRMLDVPNGENENGVSVNQWEENGFDPQKWKVESLGNGYYKLTTAISGYTKALTVLGGNGNDGNDIVISDDIGAESQQFLIKAEPDGTYGILSRCSSGKSGLDVFNMGKENGVNIVQWSYWSGAGQKWIFEPIN